MESLDLDGLNSLRRAFDKAKDQIRQNNDIHFFFLKFLKYLTESGKKINPQEHKQFKQFKAELLGEDNLAFLDIGGSEPQKRIRTVETCSALDTQKSRIKREYKEKLGRRPDQSLQHLSIKEESNIDRIQENERDDNDLKVTPLYPVRLLKMMFIKDHSFCGQEDEAQIKELVSKHGLSHYRQIPLDGNCFYRAVYYCLMELILLDQANHKGTLDLLSEELRLYINENLDEIKKQQSLRQSMRQI